MADGIHAHVGEDVGHHFGMDHVGFAGIARLAFVILAGEEEGLVERTEIVLGAVLADLGFQLAINGCPRRHQPPFRPILLDSPILSIVNHNAFGFRNGGLSRAGVSESVAKARVESLSHREYKSGGGCYRPRRQRMGYGTRSREWKLNESESVKTLRLLACPSLGSFLSIAADHHERQAGMSH